MAPINFIKPCMLDVVAKPNVVFICAQYAILHKATAAQAPTEQEHKNGDSGGSLKQVLADIQRDYKANKLMIPSLPDIAIQIRDAVKKPETEAEDVTCILELDPVLAARMVQVANSPIYRGGKAITTCRMAVSRLGLKNHL